jgi:hypothetical protein
LVDGLKKRKVDEMRRIQAAAKAGVTLRHANGGPMKLSPKAINHMIDLLLHAQAAVVAGLPRPRDLIHLPPECPSLGCGHQRTLVPGSSERYQCHNR